MGKVKCIYEENIYHIIKLDPQQSHIGNICVFIDTE